MQKFLLTIFIISNISAGLEVATDYEDIWAEFGIAASASLAQSDLTADGDEPEDEIACDHCCHGEAHFAGAIVSCLTLSYVRASSGDVIFDMLRQSAGQSPPTPPPNI